MIAHANLPGRYCRWGLAFVQPGIAMHVRELRCSIVEAFSSLPTCLFDWPLLKASMIDDLRDRVRWGPKETLLQQCPLAEHRSACCKCRLFLFFIVRPGLLAGAPVPPGSPGLRRGAFTCTCRAFDSLCERCSSCRCLAGALSMTELVAQRPVKTFRRPWWRAETLQSD